MIERQLQVQLKMKPVGRDPRDLEGNEMMEFIRWNILALEDELHEALKECGWKPWATSRHLNRDLFIKEMVDAWHFFMNLLLVVSPGRSSEQLAEEFAEKYFEKAQINEERQKSGYSGVETKCSNCGRDLDAAGVRIYSGVYDAYFCSRTCIGEYGRKVSDSGSS
jgi:hypothetical protein